MSRTLDLILGVIAATAMALLLALIARDDLGMPPDMVREDALIAANAIIAAVAGCRAGGNRRRGQLASDIERPKRLVTLRRDGDDFVVLFYPEDIVVFRNSVPQPLRSPSMEDHQRQRWLGRYDDLCLREFPVMTQRTPLVRF
jgi:hypothetical protein